MTNKEFVSTVVEQLVANPRKVLAGHGISGAMLNKIKTRDDIFAKLASILNKLKTFKRGAIGLKKSAVFQIKIYRNFNELNAKARLDVDNFIAGLKPEDAEKFSNANNLVTCVFDLKDCNLEGEEERMAAGFSNLEKFDNVVKKEYKIPGVAYMVIMYADSAIRTVELKTAERKSSRNERENKREGKPAKLKKALADKKKLAQKIRKIKAEYNEKIAENNEELKALRAQQQKLKFQNQQIARVGNQNALNKKFKEGRIEELKVKLAKAVEAAEKYVAMLDDATGKARLSIQSMLSKKNKEIRALRAKLGTYNRLGPAAIAKKADMLKLVQQKIQSNIAKGEAISTAMNKALEAINARPAQKQIIKQQVINQVAEGTPMQYAVQQAIQDNVNVDGSLTDQEIDLLADNIISENNGKAPKQRMLNYQISRFGYDLDKDDVTRVSETINNKLLNAEEFNDVVEDTIDDDETADILTSGDSTNFESLINEIDNAVKAKRIRRTKKEVLKEKKLKEKAKKEKIRAAKEKAKLLKLAKKEKIRAAKEKALLKEMAKKQKLAAKKNQLNGIDKINKIDPVVQQIINMDDNYVNPDKQVIPDLDDELKGSTDFAELLNML